MLFPELEAKALLGKVVGDVYGRTVGRAIGIDRNPFGELEGIKVETTGGDLFTAKARQIALTPRTVTLTPEWKIDSDDLITELDTLRKRVEALESLKDSREIEGEIYGEILGAQKAGYLEKVDSAEALSDSMKARVSLLTSQISSLTRYLIHAKLDHKSGQLDDSSLKLARDSIEPSLRPLIAERNDLAATLRNLEKLLPTRVSIGRKSDPPEAL